MKTISQKYDKGLDKYVSRLYNVHMKRTTFNLTDADLRAIKAIRKQYNLTNDTAAIRLALALTARKTPTKGTPMYQMYEVITGSGDLQGGAAWNSVAVWEFLRSDERGEVHHVFTKMPTRCEQMLSSDPIVIGYRDLGQVEADYDL